MLLVHDVERFAVGYSANCASESNCAAAASVMQRRSAGPMVAVGGCKKMNQLLVYDYEKPGTRRGTSLQRGKVEPER